MFIFNYVFICVLDNADKQLNTKKRIGQQIPSNSHGVPHNSLIQRGGKRRPSAPNKSTFSNVSTAAHEHKNMSKYVVSGANECIYSTQFRLRFDIETFHEHTDIVTKKRKRPNTSSASVSVGGGHFRSPKENEYPRRAFAKVHPKENHRTNSSLEQVFDSSGMTAF